MTYMIDAWLERSNPFLRIVECATGQTCARIDASELQAMRDQGDLNLEDLLSNEPHKLKEVIRRLFLAQALYDKF